MSKRFTDSKKWRNQWFRELPLKAKLAWIYLCDECEAHGVWKADYGLASYQLNFNLSQDLLKEWFGDKLYFFNNDHVLIVQFFEFQYGDSKDSWSAKVGAKNKLETLGFTIINNELINPNKDTVGDSVGQSDTFLIKGIGKVKGNINYELEFEKIWNEFKTLSVQKGSKAFDRFKEQMKNQDDLNNLWASIVHYKAFLALEENKWRKPKQTFETYLGTKPSGFFWHDFIDPASSVSKSKPDDTFSFLKNKQETA